MVTTVDGVQKMCHYRACGFAQRNIKPIVPPEGRYFGKAADRVQEAKELETFGKVCMPTASLHHQQVFSLCLERALFQVELESGAWTIGWVGTWVGTCAKSLTSAGSCTQA